MYMRGESGRMPTASMNHWIQVLVTTCLVIATIVARSSATENAISWINSVLMETMEVSFGEWMLTPPKQRLVSCDMLRLGVTLRLDVDAKSISTLMLYMGISGNINESPSHIIEKELGSNDSKGLKMSFIVHQATDHVLVSAEFAPGTTDVIRSNTDNTLCFSISTNQACHLRWTLLKQSSNAVMRNLEIDLTEQPTTSPSLSPSASPLEDLDDTPVSEQPSISPSVSPTSGSPSTSPTRLRTSSPSFGPASSEPTISPMSSAPSRIPSSRPTVFQGPKRRNTRYPTRFPTKAKKIVVTAYPTRFPTRKPTKFPTNRPSRNPTFTSFPTRSPSTSPTRFPTSQPTTKSPTVFSCGNFGDMGTCISQGCAWSWFVCVSINAAG